MNYSIIPSTFTNRRDSPVFIRVSRGEGCSMNLHPTFTSMSFQTENTKWCQIVESMMNSSVIEGEGWVKVFSPTFTSRNPDKHWRFAPKGEGWRFFNVTALFMECAVILCQTRNISQMCWRRGSLNFCFPINFKTRLKKNHCKWLYCLYRKSGCFFRIGTDLL